MGVSDEPNTRRNCGSADPPAKNIRIATAEKPQGPYSRASKPITGDYWAEGPSAIKIDDTWFVYFDKYKEHTYGAVISKDLKNWQDISEKVIIPKGASHGTIFHAPQQTLTRISQVNSCKNN